MYPCFENGQICTYDLYKNICITVWACINTYFIMGKPTALEPCYELPAQLDPYINSYRTYASFIIEVIPFVTIPSYKMDLVKPLQNIANRYMMVL